MHSIRPNKPLLSPESALASEIFDQFVGASTFKSILNLHRQMCETLRIKPSTFPSFYVKLKSKLRSWKAASLWSKLDKRAGHKCYNRGRVAAGTRVLVIGAGPCGLRTAIEAQLLGAKVVVIEKRDRFSRNNVLHLWPFVIHDLRNLGAKKFYGKFCAGSIDHISIRQLQCILLKVALLLGVEIHENVGFNSLVEPPLDQSNEKIGWRATFVPSDHPVSQYEFGVLIGADGKRNTLSGFKKKEFRGKLAIAITANYINKHTLEEARIEEISGVAFIFNQKFFHDLRDATGIDLENIVYYKDETHYFVMTAKKQSLIYKGVILNDYPDTAKLLSSENVDRDALMAYAREAADFSTNYNFPHLDFAVNHYGKPDIAMFDFTSMYAAENASQVIERRGHKLLLGLVGDTLLEPFWPTGSGCARGFLSAFDAAWMIRSFASGKLSVLQVLAERECVFRLLAQTTPENLSKDFNGYTLNPASRYPNLNVQKVQPGAVKLLYDSDVPISERPMEIVIPNMSIEEDTTIPSKRKRKDSTTNPDMLLAWCQRQVRLYDVQIEDMTSSWKSGIALGSILHRYRPDLIDVESMSEETVEQNNRLVFGILEKDYGVVPVMTAKEMAECDEPDQLAIISYISQVYDVFKGEIPYVVRDVKDTSPENEAPTSTPARKITPNTSKSSLIHRLNHRIHKRQSSDKNASTSDSMKKSRTSMGSNKRRSMERGRMAQLFPYQEQMESNPSGKPSIGRLLEDPDKFKDRCKVLEDKIRHDFGMITREERRALEDEAWNKKKPPMPVGKIEREQWNVKMLEEKLKMLKDGKPVEKEKKYHVDGSRLTQDIFDSKLQNIDAKLKASGRDVAAEKRFDRFDAKMKVLEKKLRVGPDLDIGVRGSNKVANMASQLSKSSDDRPHFFPPVSKSTSSKSVYLGLGVHGSEVCYFCKQRVYLMERMSAEGLFFHRGCFKCEYCGTALRLGGHAFDRTKQFGGKFYCQAHFGMQRVERPKYMRQVIGTVTDGSEPATVNTPEDALTPTRQHAQTGNLSKRLSMEGQRSHLDIPMAQISNRGLTPERAEFENSYADMTSEDELSELDEDEWTERNFGSSFEQDTSDDEYSDLSTDSDSDDSLEEEVERSLTVDETRRLAERWNRRYSQDTLVDVGGSTDEEIKSDSDTDIDEDSDVFSSDEEYAKFKADNKEKDKQNSSGDKTPAAESGSTSSTLDKEEKVKSDDEFTHSDDYSSYTSTESEEEAPPVQHEIPEIVIEEMLTKPLNSDEEHLVPEAVEVFQAVNNVYDKEKISRKPVKVVEENANSTSNASIQNEICIKIKPETPADEQINVLEDKSVSREGEPENDLKQDAPSENLRSIKNEVILEKENLDPVLNQEVFQKRSAQPLNAANEQGLERDNVSALEPVNEMESGDGKVLADDKEENSTIFIKTVTGPPRSRLGIMKAKCRDDERRHTSPVSIRDITRAKEEFLKCGGDMKKRSASPVKKDALFKTLQSIEQLQRVLESPPLSENKNYGSGDGLDRMQRSARSMSPAKPTPLYSSRFRSMINDRHSKPDDSDMAPLSRGYILSKTASTSCVPTRKTMFPLQNVTERTDPIALSKTPSTSDIPVKAQDFRSNASDVVVTKETTTEDAANLTSPKITLEPVFEVPHVTPEVLDVAKTIESSVVVETFPIVEVSAVQNSPEIKTEEKSKILKTTESISKSSPNLLSPSKKNKKNDIMLDSESMSSTSTLNDEDYISYKNNHKANSISQNGDVNNSSLNSKPVSSIGKLPLADDSEFDRDADDLSGSDWANDDLASACEDDIDFEFNQIFAKNRFVTTREKKPRKDVARCFSWDEDDLSDIDKDIFSKPTQLIDDPDVFHAAFVQSISGNNEEDKTPIVADAKFIESDGELDTPIAECISPLCKIPGDVTNLISDSKTETPNHIEKKANAEIPFKPDGTEPKKSIVHTKLTSKSLEYLKQNRLSESTGSDDSLYQTPDGNTNAKYKGYTGNFAKKVSPFGSILDSVLKKKNESLSTDSIASSRNLKNESIAMESEEENAKVTTPSPNVEKRDTANLKLKLMDFDKNNGEKKLFRRRSIHGDTPKSTNEEDMFYTPATSRKKCPDQRPWSVYGTPTETRKVMLPFESTPNNKVAIDFRELTTVERNKLRNEARQRARLKSDEELGLSPSHYRRKYSFRTESVSEKPEISDASVDDRVFTETLSYTENIVDPTLQNNEKSDHHANVPTVPDSTVSRPVENGSQFSVSNLKSDESKNNANNTISSSKPSEVSPATSKVGTEAELKKEDRLIVAKNSLDRKRNDNSTEIVKSDVPKSVENTQRDSSSHDSYVDVDSKRIDNSTPTVKSDLPKSIENSQIDSSSRDSCLEVGTGSRGSTLEREKKKKSNSNSKKKKEADDEKPTKRKSFFSMLSLASKSPDYLKKQEKAKEGSPSSVSGESNPSTPKNSKERSFLKIRLSRSKEKFREKKRECDRGEALVPAVSTNVDDVPTPVTSVDHEEEVNKVSNLVRSTSPPQASDDSFTESEEKNKRFALSAEQLLNRSELTEKIVTESLLGRKCAKDKEDRQQKLQKIAKKVQRQQEWKRHRLAQEIQRSLEELDVKRKQFEQQGVELEKALRKQDANKDKNPQVMNDWLNMVHQKNKLNNEEQDLLIRLKELQLEDRHSRLQKDLRSRMAIDDSQKDKSEIDEERKILKEMLEIVEERDALVEVLEENKQKQEKADKEFLVMMQSKTGRSSKTPT